MRNIFINLSNHPTSKWSEEQLTAAKKFGEIIDIPFPQVSPEATRQEVSNLAFDCYKEIADKYEPDYNDVTIHIMGEMTFTHNFVLIASMDCICVASTTERIVTENPDGSKTSTFKFVQFRAY